MRNILRTFLAVVSSFFSLVTAVTALLCFVLTASIPAKLCAFALVILAWLLKHFSDILSHRRRLLLPAVSFSLVCVMFCVSSLYVLAPKGRVKAPHGIASNYSPSLRFPVLKLFSLFPERDQVYLGTYLAGLLDRLMDYDQAKRLREMSDTFYRQMAQDPEFKDLEPALPLGYLDVLGLAPNQGHLYYYQPKRSAEQQLPVVVFAHGDAGNFMTYAWLFKQFAEKRGFIVVQPTFGFGMWGRPGAVETVLHAKRYALEHLNADPSRVYLAALSGGGVLASKIALEHPKEFQSIAFISPLPDRAAWLSSELPKHWSDRELLLIHGTKDRRIPMRYIRNLLNGFRINGGQVKLISLEEDHLLFYTQWKRVIQYVARHFEAETKAGIATQAPPNS